MIDLNTWIVSDTHFGHKAIVRFCNRPLNHDEIMENRWRDLVAPDDPILHLGDVATWKNDAHEWLPMLRDLPGHKMLVPGNHDKNGDSYYKEAGFTEVGTLLGEFVEEDVTREGLPYRNNIKNHGFYQEFDGRRVLFSHYPDAWLLDWDVNIHGHIHNNPYSSKLDRSRNYINVSVEVMDYKPVKLGELLDNEG